MLERRLDALILPFALKPPRAENTVTGAWTGRQQWGQASFKSIDSWDDGEDTDARVSISKKPTSSSPKETALDGSICWLALFLYFHLLFIIVLKNIIFLFRFPESKIKLPSNRADPTSLSAKQHYLRQSRYLPGEKQIKPLCDINTRGNIQIA